MSVALPWSYSKLSLFKKCPRAFQFRYIEKIPTEFGAAAARGSRIHQQLELFVSGNSLTLDVNPSVVEYLRDLRERNLRNPGYVSLECDVKFTDTWVLVDDGQEYWGRCIFDLVDTAEHLILDYKTGSEYPTHIEQAKYYSLAYSKLIGHIPKVILLYIDSAVVHEMDFALEALNKCEQEIRELTANINSATEFAPCRGSHCSWCDFKKKGLCT